MEDKKLKELQREIEAIAKKYCIINAGFFGMSTQKGQFSFEGISFRVNDFIDWGYNAARYYQFTRESIAKHLKAMENVTSGTDRIKEVSNGTE